MSQSETVKKNLEISHKATESSRFQKDGLSDQKTKLNSKNFDKLMSQRGLSEEARADLKKSGTQMEVRHAKAGEKFVTTHGVERSSGVFVSEKSLGKTPEERIDKGALPHTNSAEYETTVELTRDQNVIYGKIAPQSKFSKMDPNQAPRNGGGEQVITDGGYNSGAIINKDAKYPVPAKDAFMQQAKAYDKKHGIESHNSTNSKSNTQSHGKSHGHSR